jgi:hypothetical protein
MTVDFDETNDEEPNESDRRQCAVAGSGSTDGLPELVAAAYERAPTPVRTKFIEYLLGPLGPLAVVAIANGAFGHLLHRLRRDAVPISLDDAARVTSSHILELARYVEQCSPDALLRITSLITERPGAVVTIGGSALLIGLIDWMRRQDDHRN